MEIRISLSPSGGLRLHVPNAKRTLDIPVDYAEKVQCQCCGETTKQTVSSTALRTIKRILRNASEFVPARELSGHIGAFPTQAVIDAWIKQDEERKVADEKQKWATKGIDLEKLEFKL